VAIPLRPGRTDDLLTVVLTEEWFMLLCNTVWRREVWAAPPAVAGAVLRRPSVLPGGGRGGWPIYFLDTVLAAYTLHRGQSGAWRGQDSGLGVADDVLAFWAGWLAGKPSSQSRPRPSARPLAPTAGRALAVVGTVGCCPGAVATAEALAGTELPGLRRLKTGGGIANPVVRGAVALKRGLTHQR